MVQKILIAEDDAILREILMEKIASAGYKTLGAEDGAKALELAKAEKPDLILLDILLPVKDGLEVLAEIRKDTAIADTPVIAISNSEDTQAVSKAKSLGVKEFLIKAVFDSSDVITKIGQVLQNKTSNNPGVIETKVGTQSTSKLVFIVEDDRFLREIASQKLEGEGFSVANATGGKEALEYLEQNKRPDIIVLDLILPGISGFEVLEKIKSNPTLKEIPVIILSNLGQEEDIEKAKKLGANDYLVKAHFSFAEIIKKIHEVVG